VTTINADGLQIVSLGGLAESAVIASGAEQYVDQGGSAKDTTVYASAVQVLNGGSAINTFVNSDARQELYSNALAQSTVVSAGGSQIISGGLASNTQVYGAQMLNTGSASDTVIYSGATQQVWSGTVTSTTISGGAQWVNTNGQAIATTVKDGGWQTVGLSGFASNTVVSSGGSQIVSKGSVADTQVSNGGMQTLQTSATATGTVISLGGSQVISSGALAQSATVNTSGVQHISSGGSATGTTVSGGLQWVENGGVDSQTVVSDNGQQYLYGNADSTTVLAGAHQRVFSGALANNTSLESASQTVSSGGSATATHISAGGLQTVDFAASATSATISSGGTQQVAGQVANTLIEEGGTQQVAASGIASTTTVSSGGIQSVSADGRASSATVSSGGTQNVAGIANDTTLFAGAQNILSGGYVGATVINSDGVQTVSSGGAAVGTTISSGTMNIYQGATVNGVTASDGVLNMYGDNTLQGNISLANANVNINHTSAMNTLTVSNLAANNTTFNMNVDLEQQTADKLNITDNYTGDSLLQFTNVAGSAQLDDGNGIQVVEFGSNANIDGTFALAGGQWDEGGYVYKLFKGDVYGIGQDYYLRNTKALSNMFKTMLNIPVMNVVVAQTGMNSLQKRMGDLRDMNNPAAKQGIWVRSYYKDMTVKDLAKTDISLFGAEAGYDWLFRADEPTKLYAGVLVGFVSANSIKTENNNGMYDKGDGEAPGVGVYATLVNENGWFVDIAARNFWTKLDMENHATDGRSFVYKPSRNVLATSLEVGKNFNTELARNKFLRIEPKVEIGYTNAAAADTDVINTAYKIKYNAANYVNAKAGVLLSYSAIRDNGLLIAPLLELAYRHEFSGKGKVSYGGAEDESDLSGGTAEINAGLNMQLTDNLYWYGLGSYEASDKVKGWGVHAGIRYAFGGTKAVKPKKAKQIKQPKIKKEKATTKVTTTNKQDKNDYSLMEEIERRWREGK